MSVKRKFKHALMLVPLALASTVLWQNCSKNQPSADTDSVPVVQSHYDQITPATALAVLATTGSFNLSVPNGGDFIDLAFTEDNFIPAGFQSTATDGVTTQPFSGGAIRFFHGTSLTPGIQNFDFARLVVIQPGRRIRRTFPPAPTSSCLATEAR